MYLQASHDCSADAAHATLQDSTYKYYEIILIDIQHKVVRQVCPHKDSLCLASCWREPRSCNPLQKCCFCVSPKTAGKRTRAWLGV